MSQINLMSKRPPNELESRLHQAALSTSKNVLIFILDYDRYSTIDRKSQQNRLNLLFLTLLPDKMLSISSWPLACLKA